MEPSNLPKHPSKKYRHVQHPYEPTEEEMAIAKAEIQSRWSDAERKKRASVEDVPYTIPEAKFIGMEQRRVTRVD